MTPELWRALDQSERRNWLLSVAGKRSNRWIAHQIGCKPRHVPQRCHRHGICPTRSQGMITASQAALILGMTPQGVARLCRLGKLRARRNRQRKRWDYPIRRQSTPWWQIRLEDIATYAGLSLSQVVGHLAEEKT